MSFFEKLIKRRKRSELRRKIRALINLGRGNEPYLPHALYMEALRQSSPDIKLMENDPLIEGVTPQQASLCLQQLLMRATLPNKGILKFTLAIDAPDVPASYPYPPSTRAYMRANGYAVSNVRSWFAWNTLKARFLLDGIRRAIKVFTIVYKDHQDNALEFANHNVFMRSDQFANIAPDQIESRWSFLTWFRNSRINNHEAIILHRMSAVDQPPPLPKDVFLSTALFNPSIPPKNRRQFVGEVVTAVVKSFLHFFGNKWWYAVLLRELVDLAHARAVPSTAFAKLYMMPLNHLMVRFLWTYLPERTGSEFALLHYSHSCSEFHPISPDYFVPTPGYAFSTWGTHVVWSEEHAAELRKHVVGDVKYVIDPPNFFVTPETPFPKIDGPTVVIFDVGTPSLVTQVNEGIRNTYLVLETQLEFVRASVKAIRRAGATPVWKPKWVASCPRPVKQLAQELDIIMLQDDAVPTTAIEASTASISMPFTTSGAVARHLGKPSCYFDPTGKLRGYDHLAFDSPLIVGSDALEAWLKKVLKAD